MKVASRSGFFVFLGGILAARNVAHVRAAFTLEAPVMNTGITDLSPASVPSTALLAPPQYVGDLVAPHVHTGELLPPFATQSADLFLPPIQNGELTVPPVEYYPGGLSPSISYAELMSPQVHFVGLMSWMPMGK